jgi:hypothetical protein
MNTRFKCSPVSVQDSMMSMAWQPQPAEQPCDLCLIVPVVHLTLWPPNMQQP